MKRLEVPATGGSRGTDANTLAPDCSFRVAPGRRSYSRYIEPTAMPSGFVKSLWASIQGDPVFMRRINGWLTIFWIIMIPISIVTGWLSSVVYVSALSLWALVSGHWAAWQAARVEVEQQREERRAGKRNIAKEVVDALIAETNIKRTS